MSSPDTAQQVGLYNPIHKTNTHPLPTHASPPLEGSVFLAISRVNLDRFQIPHTGVGRVPQGLKGVTYVFEALNPKRAQG